MKLQSRLQYKVFLPLGLKSARGEAEATQSRTRESPRLELVSDNSRHNFNMNTRCQSSDDIWLEWFSRHRPKSSESLNFQLKQEKHQADELKEAVKKVGTNHKQEF